MPFGLALVSVLWVYDGWADVSFVGGEVKDPRAEPSACADLRDAHHHRALSARQPGVSRGAADRRDPQIQARRRRRRGAGDGNRGSRVRVGGRDGVDFRHAQRLGDDRRRGCFSLRPRTGSSSSRSPGFTRSSRRPSVAIVLEAVLGVLFVLVGTFEQLADAFVTAIVPFYALAVASVFVLRRRPGYDSAVPGPGLSRCPGDLYRRYCPASRERDLDPASRYPTLAVLGIILVGIPVFYLSRGQKNGERPLTRGERLETLPETVTEFLLLILIPARYLMTSSPSTQSRDTMIKTRLLLTVAAAIALVTGASLGPRPGNHHWRRDRHGHRSERRPDRRRADPDSERQDRLHGRSDDAGQRPVQRSGRSCRTTAMP